MGRPKRPQVEGHGRGTWERRLRDNRRRHKTQTSAFILEQMAATEQRYLGYIAELDELDKEYQAALEAAEKAQTTRPDTPVKAKQPVNHDTYHDTPYGRAREGSKGELFMLLLLLRCVRVIVEFADLRD